MDHRADLTVKEREQIFQGKLQGQTLAAVATPVRVRGPVAVGCSPACARKWWRIGRRQGSAGLGRTGRRRSRTGSLSRFAPQVAEQALLAKRAHPGRGATRILVDLAADPLLSGVRLPQRSQLAAFFRQACPQLLRKRQPARHPSRPPIARRVHELWQVDAQEAIRLGDGSLVTTLEVREPVACLFLASRAHAVQTEKGWRKLTVGEIQADLRIVFTQYGLPEGLQTDREPVYGQPVTEGFPSRFTLWLVGLGLRHAFSRPAQPKDQPQVERGHRTLSDWRAGPAAEPDLLAWQRQSEVACHLHNAILPSRAGDCAHRPPLVVHPDAGQVHRPYQPSAEWALFDLQRVDQFLDGPVWPHKVSTSGQVYLQSQPYTVGHAHRGKRVDVRFLPDGRLFSFTDVRTGLELKRQPARGLDVRTLTGLEAPPIPGRLVQLSFPCH